MDESAMKGLELNVSDAMRARSSGRNLIDDVLSEHCSCEEKKKWRCVVLNFFKGLRLNASEVEGVIARSKTIDDTSDSKSKSELCDMFTLLKGLELHGGAPTRKPPTSWQEVDARLPYNPTLAASSLTDEVKLGRCTRVSVEGYDILYPLDLVKSELRKHFLGCGEICDVVIPFDRRTCRISDRCAVIYFWEEGAEEKALALNGTDVGRWNLIVKPLPKKVCELSTDQVAAALKDLRFQDSRRAFLCVRGYDTGLPLDDVKSALFKLFSPCGEITCLNICKPRPSNLLSSPCYVSIWGDGALEKAKALSGSDVGGWNVVVETPQKEEDHGKTTPITNIGWSGPPLRLRNTLRGWDGARLPKLYQEGAAQKKGPKRKRSIAAAEKDED